MKVNFKKLFVSILACISVVPSANFKTAAIDYVDINSAQDWLDIAERIRQDEHYTEGKYFNLNNDIVLDVSDQQHHTEWCYLFGTLDGNNHKIILSSDEAPCAISSIKQSGRVTNVEFVSLFVAPITQNCGLIDNCRATGAGIWSDFETGLYLVRNNENCGTIRSCELSMHCIVYHNSGTIDNCSLRINDAQKYIHDKRKTGWHLGNPDEHIGSDDVWNSEDLQHRTFVACNFGGAVSNCRVLHQNP